MRVKSPLLLRHLEKAFGVEAGRAFLASLEAGEGVAAGQASRLAQLLTLCDGAYATYASLQQQQAKLSGDTYSDWNLQTGAIESGRGWKALLGYAEKAVADTVPAWQKLAHADDLAILRARIAAHIDGHTDSFAAECRMRAADGRWHWLLLRGLLTRRTAAGEALRLLVMHRDIDAFKLVADRLGAARDDAERANQSRGAFLANMSHEIRTPLNGIIGMTDLALDTQLNGEQRQYLKTAKSSAESLLEIVNTVLDFSQIETGNLEFEAIAFSVPDLVLETARVHAVAAHGKGLEVIVDVATDVPAQSLGDPTRLRQVLGNLIGNAVKFTERGEIVITVSVVKVAPDSLRLQFAVRDTGIGIAEDKQGGVFEAFSQQDGSATRRYGGTGLGLAICSRLAQLMGGELRLESTERKGSTFFLSTRFGLRSTPPATLPGHLKGKRALVAAANAEVGRHLQLLLGRLGLAAEVCSEDAAAKVALEHARALKTPFDFVFADVALAPPHAASAVPLGEALIMLLTTENQQHNLRKLRELAACTFLVKPIGASELLDALLLASDSDPDSDASFALEPFVIEASGAPSPRLEILLVEDNPVNQERTRRLLESGGHRVSLASNGAQALECFDAQRFAVILMDLQMPVMDGFEAAEAIRAKEMRRTWIASEDLKPVYIVALTSTDADRQRCRDAGMDDSITKPVGPDELDAALERALRDREEAFAEHAASNFPVDPMVLNLALALDDIGDLALLVHMVKMLLSDWDTHLVQIVAALAAADQYALLMHTFTLKSLLAMFHAEKARKIALDLEKSLADNASVDFACCRSEVDRLQLAMDDLKPHLQRFAQTQVIA